MIPDSTITSKDDCWITRYWAGIQSGKYIVGALIKLQMQKLLELLQDDEVIKDFTDSNMRINFIQRECKHAQAPFAGKPFILTIWQKAIIEALYSFKIYDEELKKPVRLFQRLLLCIGRKNGKSPLISAISLAEWVCGEMGTNILFGSNDYDQASILFDATDAMREASPKIARCTHRNLKGLFWGNKARKHARGKFSFQNKGSIKKLSARTSAKEGKNIKVGCVDEVHEMKDNTLVMPIRQALSTQDEPLYLEITTEGFTDNGYLDEEMEEAQQVLMDDSHRSRWLIFLYQQDSEEEVWQNEQSWCKSNPGLGVIKKWTFLRQMVGEARNNAATKSFVLAKDFNIKQNSAAAWLDMAAINNPETFDLADLKGQYYLGGVDLAETTDLCCARALFVDPETRLLKSLAMYFIPEIKANAILEDNGLNPEKKDYNEWAKQGLVTICPGTEVDDSMVVDWFKNLYVNYHLVPFKIGYDNWHSQDFKKGIAELFGADVLERIGMDFNSLSGPMSVLESYLKEHMINYNNNPVDRWCLTNTAIRLNNIGQMMPVKKFGQSKNRIDGTLGYIIAVAVYLRYKTDYLAIQGGQSAV